MFDLHQIYTEQLADLGQGEVAYVRPVSSNGVTAFAIHAADGTPLALAGGYEAAVQAIQDHDMLPQMVH